MVLAVFIVHLAQQITKHSASDCPDSSCCFYGFFLLPGRFSVGCLTKQVGSGTDVTGLLYTFPSPQDATLYRMPSSAGKKKNQTL